MIDVQLIVPKRLDKRLQFLRDHSPLIKRSRLHYFSWFLNQFPRFGQNFKGGKPYLVIFEGLARWSPMNFVWMESSHQSASIPTIFGAFKILLYFLLTLFVRDCKCIPENFHPCNRFSQHFVPALAAGVRVGQDTGHGNILHTGNLHIPEVPLPTYLCSGG